MFKRKVVLRVRNIFDTKTKQLVAWKQMKGICNDHRFKMFETIKIMQPFVSIS